MGTDWEEQIWGPRKPRRSPADSGNNGKCKCSYQRAGDALRRRKFRLAVRYVRLDIKTRMGVLS